MLGGATLLALIPMFVAARYLRGSAQMSGVANARPIERKPTSLRFRIVTAVVLTLVLGIGVVIPVSTLLLWVWDGVQRSLEFVNPTGAVLDTVWIACAGTLMTLVVAWLPAWLWLRITAWAVGAPTWRMAFTSPPHCQAFCWHWG